ncbi:MAG: DUF4097 family beta strand repeat-containing protein [Thermoplasmatota archaeon]
MRVALAVALLVLAGCTTTPPATNATDLHADAAAAAAHGAPQRDDGPVTVGVTASPPGYEAQEVVTVKNGLAGFPGAIASYTTPGGSADVTKGDAGQYVVVATLKAAGATEAEARQRLATMHLDVTDQVEGGVLHIGEAGRFDDNPPSLTTANERSLDLAVHLDGALAYDLSGDTGGGDLSLSDLHGTTLHGNTGGGTISGSGLSFGDAALTTGGGSVSTTTFGAQNLVVTTGGGAIDVQAEAVDARLESGGGALTANLRPTASGSFTLHTGGGSVDATLARQTGIAYDVRATTGGGTASVSLHDAPSDGTGGDVHARSPDWATATIQSTVDASSGGGSVSVHD